MTRQPRAARPTHSSTPPSTRPFRSIESQMSAEHVAAMERACAAELAGDWAAALAHHRSVPMFAESAHGARLGVLTRLGGAAPQWLVTRMLTSLAQRGELYDPIALASRALERVAPLLYPHGVPFERMDCAHAEQIPAMIHGHDWVVRQVDVYDLGGLRRFAALPEAAGALTQSPYVEAWAEAPMGGYRVVGVADDVMTVADAMTGEETDLLNLGLTLQHVVGSHVIGRIVPGDTPTGHLFDAAPLPIDARIAREVAARPGAWLTVIADRVRSGALQPAFSHLPETSLSSDLPRYSWAALLGYPIGEDLPRAPRSMAAQALKTALGLATDPVALAPQRHLVAALLLDELVDDRLIARFATAPYASAWQALARSLPSTAGPVCAQAAWLAEACRVDDDLAG